MTTRPDPLDDVLREAHRRGQVVLAHPTAGLVFVHAVIEPRVYVATKDRERVARLDQMKPARPAGGSRS